MNASTAINTYARVGLESSVTSADPHRLISMLYQGALLAVANAKASLLHHDVAAKGESISKAIMIINDGLNASLDRSVGGDLALNLGALYDYMCSRLLQANLKNDAAALDEVSTLLNDLKSAWDSIRQNAKVSTPPAPARSAAQLYGKV